MLCSEKVFIIGSFPIFLAQNKIVLLSCRYECTNAAVSYATPMLLHTAVGARSMNTPTNLSSLGLAVSHECTWHRVHCTFFWSWNILPTSSDDVCDCRDQHTLDASQYLVVQTDDTATVWPFELNREPKQLVCDFWTLCTNLLPTKTTPNCKLFCLLSHYLPEHYLSSSRNLPNKLLLPLRPAKLHHISTLYVDRK